MNSLFSLLFFLTSLFAQDYTYTLTDINPESPSYNVEIGPAYFSGKVTLHYFGHQY